MTLKLGINGFGRIGRLCLRAALQQAGVEVVAVNDLTDSKTNAHLFKYDSVHGRYKGDVGFTDNSLIIDGKTVQVFAEKDPAQIPWGQLGVDIVIEATGKFTDGEKAQAHIQAGAKKVIISAPAKNEDLTIVMGVNEKEYDAKKHHIVSNASCTTNCLAPVVKVLDQEFKIIKGLMTTIHSFTNDQRILDQTHTDLRRARAAAESMIPTTTGAARAVAKVLPQMAGKLHGFAIRVPTPNVSIVDLVVDVEKKTTCEEVNAVLKKASENELKGILGYTETPLVSVDYNNNPLSSIIDGPLTLVKGDDMVKVMAWYDNEWGYSSRVIDLARYMAAQGL